MASRKKKFYVVWEGLKPGVYATWAECEAVTRGVPHARFKAFPTAEAAERAFREGPDPHWGTGKFVSALTPEQLAAIGDPIPHSLCVDAAWNARGKEMEYRGVWLQDRSILFQEGPLPLGTNNLGEFLAIVQALSRLKELRDESPIYSDSQTAMVWVRQKRVASQSMEKGETGPAVNQRVQEALAWLHNNEYANPILKWQTEAWGDIPADYGRK